MRIDNSKIAVIIGFSAILRLQGISVVVEGDSYRDVTFPVAFTSFMTLAIADNMNGINGWSISCGARGLTGARLWAVHDARRISAIAIGI